MVTRPNKFGDYRHQSEGITDVTVKIGGEEYLATVNQSQAAGATPTIVNVPSTDAAWTALATSLSNVLSWRISERSGADFRYAFTAAPATYATGFGWIAGTEPLTAVYFQRPSDTNINMELVYWS